MNGQAIWQASHIASTASGHPAPSAQVRILLNNSRNGIDKCKGKKGKKKREKDRFGEWD